MIEKYWIVSNRKRRIFFIRERDLKSESGNDLDHNIRKWHNRESDNGIYEGFPRFFELFFISPSSEKYEPDIEKNTHAHHPDKPHEIHLNIFEEIILECDIGIAIGTNFISIGN